MGGFAIDDCADPSGDPVVLYDQLEDRWLLSQFTTRGPLYYDCVAISQTGDPTGAYYRYAFVLRTILNCQRKLLPRLSQVWRVD